MDLIFILLKILSFLLFFLLTKKVFRHFSTTLFLSALFLIIPWQRQPGLFQANQVIALVLTSLFFIITYRNTKLIDFKKYYLVFIFFLLPSMVLTLRNFSINNLPFILNQQDVTQITLYQNILNPVNPTFSRLYFNKATNIIKKFEVNFFETVDLNNYFFANHPLERVGVKETEKFYSWLLPFFIIGCICLNLLVYRPIVFWVLSVFIFSGLFSNRFFELNILLLVPFLLIMGLGLEKIRYEIKIK